MNTALIVAGCIFVFVALMHLLRFIYKAEVIIAGKVVPLWVSIVAIIVAMSLATWMFTAS